jgi:hypothetical protein
MDRLLLKYSSSILAGLLLVLNLSLTHGFTDTQDGKLLVIFAVALFLICISLPIFSSLRGNVL